MIIRANNTITTEDALLLRSYVQDGGSLIVAGEYNTQTPFNVIGSAFGGVTLSAGSSSGNSTVTNHTIAPEVTDGPFGSVESLPWNRNSVAKLSSAGTEATFLDSYTIFALIPPDGYSGSVAFVSDFGMFTTIESTRANNIQDDILMHNLFAYSAHASSINNPSGINDANAVPEPSTICLLALGVSRFLFRMKK